KSSPPDPTAKPAPATTLQPRCSNRRVRETHHYSSKAQSPMSKVSLRRRHRHNLGPWNLDFGPRHGYTLMELLLVLATIVLAAAAVAPRMTGMTRHVTLNSAAQTVRAELTRAHVLAMKTSRVEVFQYELGGRKYKVEPGIAGDDAIENATGEQDSA